MEPTEPATIRPPGDRTRDHLANERTFLAWIRTSLALIGLGFVLARMGLFLRQLAAVEISEPNGRLPAGREFLITGIVFLVLGTALAGWSVVLYHRARRAIDAHNYEPAQHSASVLAAVVVVGGLAIASLVIGRVLFQGTP
ncbi:MAG: DUF202 domain-containing protein [Isosphaeraceae bacterium]